MKKLVNTPISNTIWWATVNEDASVITGNREDVTDNALEVVLQHLTGMSNYAKEKFAGYDFTQKNGSKIRMCAYDMSKYDIVVKK